MNNKDKMKTLLEAISTKETDIEVLLKQAGYKRGTRYHQPTREQYEEKVRNFEQIIRDSGAERKKDTSGNEYQYKYDVGMYTVVFNYRFGNVGLHAWWIM